MARKNIGKILSDGAVVFCVVLFCALNVSVQAAIEGQMVTYTISGSVGQPGVTMNGLPNTVTDQNGNYSAVVKYGWNGTVTPTLAGFTFEPAQIPYTKVTSDQLNQNYEAKLQTFKISGMVSSDGKPMQGVTIDGLPGSPVTGTNGVYEAIVDFGFTGNATPTKDGYIFTPGSKPYTSVNRDMPNQNYTGSMLTFTISGTTQVEGVTLKGLPDNPKSGSNGAYSVTVPFNWSGVVKPDKEGYIFEPAEIPYTNIINSYPNQDYFANPITFMISGSAGMDAVEMTGLPGPSVFTDGNGYYTAVIQWGWNGTIKPVRAGYKFTPGTMNYTKVITDKTNQNYTPEPVMLTISGTTGLSGVMMQGLPGNPVTGPDGSYNVTVDWNFSNIVIPIKEGYSFTPAETTYAAITKDQKTNYTANEIMIPISGNAGVGGVKLSGFPGRPIMSNPDGSYSAEVKYGWNGTIIPEKAGYTFEPKEITFPVLYAPEANRDFTALLEKRAISGVIRSDKGQPVEGVFVLADNDGGSTTTNANGEYELVVDYGWRGKITPTLPGHDFRPVNKPYVVPVTRDQSNQLFTAIIQMVTITDSVMVGGTGLEGVQVAANNGGGSTVTDSKGEFSVKVPFGWSGEISLEKPGFQFPSKPYTNVIEDYKNDVPVSQIIPSRRPTVPDTTPEPARPEPTTTDEPGVRVPHGNQFGDLITSGQPKTPPVTGTEPATPLTPLEQIQKQLDELLYKQRGATTTAEPNNAAPQQILIKNTFLDDQLIDALQSIAADAKVTIIPDETIVGTVSCTLPNVPVETALDIVLGGTPYVWKKTPYYYLVASSGITDSMFAKMSETRRVKMNYVTAEAAVGLLSTAFKPYVQAEIGPPGVDTYLVAVTAPPALMERIIADLEKIDRIRKQILLDARIVSMERGNLLNLGVSWTWPTVSAGLFGTDLQGRASGLGLMDFGGKVASGFSIGYTPDSTFTNALTATLNLLSTNDEATIIANPQVLAQDGKLAEISVMTEEYYFMTGNQNQTVGFFNYYSELEKVESGTKLNITPHIGDNDEITLAMIIEVSNSIASGRESGLPVVTRRTSTNTVRIKDGGTVALAGLTENRTRTEKRRTPGLSKLPIIGGLFKNTNDEGASREIAVFVTAHLIPEPGKSIDFIEPTGPATRQPASPSQGSLGPIGQIPMQQQPSYGQTQSYGQAPLQPMGNDFRASLRQSLSRPIR
ncbi:MAG: hypothetical protein JW837_05855 [Sedimentisphaerales bacterium]|nr:hypothetical protein [Sedimentisphaerales bacterium]